MVERLLDCSDRLLAESPASQAFRRRAVSTAYYAVFHALAKLCANELLGAEHRGLEEYDRVYRALDHGPLRAAFSTQPLNTHGVLRPIGDTVVRLQSERHKADYLPPQQLYTRAQSRELADLARNVVGELAALEAKDRRILASCLLFKARSR
jgi:uncharacterized protein (UPF0332 family)